MVYMLVDDLVVADKNASLSAEQAAHMVLLGLPFPMSLVD
jgi:hypothetical protein